MSAKKNRQLPLLSLSLALILGCIICACVLVGGSYEISRRTEATFGPASMELSFLERIRLSMLLLLETRDLTRPTRRVGSPQPFEVGLGESPPKIASALQSAGIISNAQAFIHYLQYSGLDRTLQAGKYELDPSSSPLEIAHALQDATPKEVTLTILEGWRAEEIAATLPTSGLEISPRVFLQAIRSLPEGYPFLEQIPTGNSLEGFLAPGSYTLPRKTTANQLVKVLLDSFGAQLTQDILEGFSRQGLSIYDAVKLASIVQREAMVDEEMPLLASVFLNRLAASMPLEADSTVQYALGYNKEKTTWWTNPLRTRHLQLDSPYNTYRYSGLPPAPIANPGINALNAVAFPAETPYYYFRAACDGSGRHVFAETYAEHLKNACP